MSAAPALLSLVLLTPAGDSLPPVGLAVRDTVGGWCATVAGPTLTAGSRMTVVVAHPDAPPVARRTRVIRHRDSPCHSEFAQGSLEGLPAYDLAPEPGDTASTPFVSLVVASEVEWRRGPGGAVAADLDGDGRLEEARVCAADEGEHFTLWTPDRDGQRRRRWHGYYDWGANVDPTCKSGEDGR